MPPRPTPQPGQIVRVRQRQYLVEEAVPPPVEGDSALVRLACLEDDAQGEPLEALWHLEVDAELLDGATWDALASRGFDPPRVFAAYLHTLRWNRVTATDPRLFQAPFRAGICLEAYQIEPLRKALQLPRVNLFIADDVGLGKTIEAGLIARELLLRKKVRDIVVACPPGVLPQWQDELENRFGLTFVVLDRDYVQRVRRQRGYSVNPWTTHSRFLISQRLLIDEGYAAPLRDWLGGMRAGSLLILDEAHHAAPSSGQRYAIDSRITRAVRDLAPRFEHRLFLSATPYNGHSNSFSALLEVLDPQRFCRGVPVRGRKQLEAVMVRRLKEDVRAIQGGFPRRAVVQLDIDDLPPDAPELALSGMLDEYRKLREARLADLPRRKQAIGKLLLCGLQQRLLSSVEAFARTLAVHRATVERLWRQEAKGGEAPRQRDLPLLTGSVGPDDDRADEDEKELADEEDAQFTAATLASEAGPASGVEAERLLLERMSEVARAARSQPDARVRLLVDWLRDNCCPDLPGLDDPSPQGPPARWNDTRVILFTEYEDTRRYLVEQLSRVVWLTDRGEERIVSYHGPTPQPRREEIKAAFNGGPTKHPVRVLVATDAAREGINLQTHCHNLFHFDVPWSPARMEQRNGRIDRKMQPSEIVFCHYFVYRQRAEDRVLRALVHKTDRIRSELGSLAQVIEGRLALLLEGGVRHADAERLVRAIDEAAPDAGRRAVVEAELEDARERQDDLREQMDRLRTSLERSAEWVGLDAGHLREALSCALGLCGSGPLEADAEGRYYLPEGGARFGADPSWTETLDALRPPRQRDQEVWQWRRETAPRPLVFDAPKTFTNEVVQLHLEHRLVQRLLGRFLAQGFLHHDLSRACLTQSADPIPRVVLIGRLCLYGPSAARLHEELIHVTARWVDPKVRKGPLVPYSREAERKTLDLLNEATRTPDRLPVNDVVAGNLLASAPQDLRELSQHLETRGAELAADAEAALLARAEKESRDMRTLLEEQRRQIETTIERDRNEQAQGFITGLLPEEERQLDADRKHWANRLKALQAEVEDEPRRVREVYGVRARRVEPVGLVYLWPVTG